MAVKKLVFAVLLVLLQMWVTQSTSRTLHAHKIETEMIERHEKWMAHHGRTYAHETEKARRFKIFKKNVAYIESVNNNNRTYKLAVNKFADLTNKEFFTSSNDLTNKEFFTSSKGWFHRPSDDLPKSQPFIYANVSRVPDFVDWRQQGAVTRVKDQGQCGSCWAFTSVAAMEGINAIKTGYLLPLSEQQLLDCASDEFGCDGGTLDRAYHFIVNNKGLTTEYNYPYQAYQQTCYNVRAAARITGYQRVPANSEFALLKAVAHQPVSVCIEGYGDDFRFYSSGIFTGRCGTELNHGVTVVGYGTNSDGTKYWLVKNSWGTEWGEYGYMRILRTGDSEGLCAMYKESFFPIA